MVVTRVAALVLLGRLLSPTERMVDATIRSADF
jgi:hypothetical protein